MLVGHFALYSPIRKLDLLYINESIHPVVAIGEINVSHHAQACIHNIELVANTTARENCRICPGATLNNIVPSQTFSDLITGDQNNMIAARRTPDTRIGRERNATIVATLFNKVVQPLE